MGGKSSQPEQPDYAKAAEATAASNRVNYNTPYGGLNYTRGDDGQWTANLNLSPTQQRLLDQQNQTSLSLGDLQGSASSRVGQMLGQGFDTSSLPSSPINPGTTAQQAIMARLQPQFDRSEEQMRARLANQGIMQGSEAYNNELNTFNQGKNDAMSQAALQGIGLDTQARQNALQEQSYLRQLPLNELNSLRTGSQVTGPNFSGMPQTQGANYLGAAQMQGQANMNAYNAQQAGQNNLMNGLFNLGSTGLMYFSDRRLKKDIQLIGTRPDGLGVYVYTYLWGEPSVGVMADEVKRLYPHAVHRLPCGYDAVNYGALHAAA